MVKLTSRYFQRYPDCHWAEDGYLIQGEEVAYRWILTYTYPPTGERVTLHGVDFHTVHAGRIARIRQYSDRSAEPPHRF